MGNNNFDFGKIGENISKMVEDAVNSKNFKELNKTITDSINKAVDGISHAAGNLGKVSANAENAFQEALKKQKSSGRVVPPEPSQMPIRRSGIDFTVYARNPAGNIAGTIQAFFGALGTLVFGIGTLGVAAGLFAGAGLAVGSVVGIAFLSLFTIGSVALTVRGAKNLSIYKRFLAYRDIIAGRPYIEIAELSERTGASPRRVLRDLEAMRQRRMFLQAQFTNEQNGLILTREAYNFYLHSLATQSERAARLHTDEAEDMPDEARQAVATGYDYIRRIREANVKLPDEKISRKLDRLEIIITRILSEVKKQPKKAEDLHKFMSYYLPTTWKLIDSYMEFDQQPIQTKNMLDAKTEIENTLDTINAAFETLLDELFEEKSWNISADISVLETMLKQEGLSGGASDFTPETPKPDEKQ